MKVGYVRISTREQNTARQDVLMEQLGVERVYTDKLSGKNTERPELQKMMDFVREGDVVVVESFSRFARNLRDLLDLTETLKKKGVQFISQKERIDTSGPAGPLKVFTGTGRPGKSAPPRAHASWGFPGLPGIGRPKIGRGIRSSTLAKPLPSH